MKYLCYFYKIVNSEDSKVYIGSTRSGLRKRFWSHRKCCRAGKQAKVYQHMREVGIEKFDIVEVKRQEVEDRQQQYMIERKIQDEFDNKLNMVRAYINDDERALRIKKYKIKYRIKNKDKIKDQNKEYNIINKDMKRSTNKKLYLANRDKIRDQQRKYYLTKKAKAEAESSIESETITEDELETIDQPVLIRSISNP